MPALHVLSTQRGSRLLSPLLLALMGTGLHAQDLPGIPVPGRINTPEWELDAGDADIGPRGGGSGDDWRVGHANLDWDHGWISAAVDYSLLTSQNPSGAPVYWGLPDPYVYAHKGAGRMDEITASVALRKSYDAQQWHGWAQVGPGIQLTGDLGGKSLQNDFHTVIHNSLVELPYEHPGVLAAGFAHAGAGGRVDVAGPFSLDTRAMDMLTTRGWTRWRVESMALVAGSSGGGWAGLRQDGAAGHALSGIADAVARHESGLSVVAGMAWHVQDLQMGLETSYNLGNYGQDGYLSLAYVPKQARPIPAPVGDSLPWHVRVGLSGDDSRVPGHGLDVEIGTGVTWLPRWMEAVVGMREDDMSVPYEYNFSGRRLMQWSGLDADPVLIGGPSASIAAHVEGGIGVRNDRLQSRGFADVDGSDSSSFTTPIARAAAGLGGSFSVGKTSYGLLVLGEATAAGKRDVDLDVHDSFDQSISSERKTIHLDGDSVGVVTALTMASHW
jgi:hypothetical protein